MTDASAQVFQRALQIEEKRLQFLFTRTMVTTNLTKEQATEVLQALLKLQISSRQIICCGLTLCKYFLLERKSSVSMT